MTTNTTLNVILVVFVLIVIGMFLGMRAIFNGVINNDKWVCSNDNVCVVDKNASSFFTTKERCEEQCPVDNKRNQQEDKKDYSYECVGANGCLRVEGDNGTYASAQACLRNCVRIQPVNFYYPRRRFPFRRFRGFHHNNNYHHKPAETTPETTTETGTI